MSDSLTLMLKRWTVEKDDWLYFEGKIGKILRINAYFSYVLHFFKNPIQSHKKLNTWKRVERIGIEF